MMDEICKESHYKYRYRYMASDNGRHDDLLVRTKMNNKKAGITFNRMATCEPKFCGKTNRNTFGRKFYLCHVGRLRSEHKVALLLEAGGELLFPESQYVVHTSLVRASRNDRSPR